MFNFRFALRSLTLLILFNFYFSIGLHAQINYQEKFSFAKKLFREGKYSLAMESFKPLTQYDPTNPFPEYASFYYALSAYHQGYPAVAKDMFTQIKTIYPNWDKRDEVTIWLAKIHFDKAEYSQGIQLLSEIKNNKEKKETEALKKTAVSNIHDVELLKSMSQKFPDDEIIAEQLAFELSKNLTKENRELLEELIKKFKLKESDFIEEIPSTIYRDVYSVSVLFPFVVNTLEPTPNRKRNQFVLDLYEGMKLAVDTLAKQGVKISLRAYDTERNPEKLKKILEKNELKNTDLIVGPLFQEENSFVQNFASANQINVFNPISNNSDLISTNPYGYLFQPGNETIGNHSAQFLAKYQTNKKCIVFYGETKRDSTLAANFVQQAKISGLKLLRVEKVSKETSKKVTDILATPTEYDEFKYAIQFSLPKDSLGCVFVATEDPLIYTKVISSVETRGDVVTVLGFESWLDQAAVNYEKYQRLNIVLAAPNFSSSDNSWYKAFQRKFVKTHGRTSSTASYVNYAKLGYDFMLFAGNSLKKNGVYFQQSLQKAKWVPGFLLEGYDFTEGRDNHLVPFIKFDGGKLVVVDKL
jgi:tetratricopeptide (TPR) repeat protein